MKTNKVGDATIKILKETNTNCVCALDGLLCEIGKDLDLPLWKNMNIHPLNYGRVASSYLRRDERFVANRIRAHDSKGRSIIITSYRLKD